MFYTYFSLVVVVEASRTHQLRESYSSEARWRRLEKEEELCCGFSSLIVFRLPDPSSLLSPGAWLVPGFFWGEFLDVFRNFFSRWCCVLCVLRSGRKSFVGFAEFGVSFLPSCTDSASFTCAFLSLDCGFCLLLCCSVVDIFVVEKIDVISFGFFFFLFAPVLSTCNHHNSVVSWAFWFLFVFVVVRELLMPSLNFLLSRFFLRSKHG